MSETSCHISAYSVEMTGPEEAVSEVYHGPDLECTITNLLPGRTYHFRVKALNDGGVRELVCVHTGVCVYGGECWNWHLKIIDEIVVGNI